MNTMSSRDPKLCDAAVVRGDLQAVQSVIAKFAALPASIRSGTAAQATVEKAVRDFIVVAAKEAPGVLGGQGFFGTADRDIVFDWSSTNDWIASARFYMEQSPVLATLEIHFRTSWDGSKLKQDIGRLEDTAHIARRAGKKTWTGLVLAGPAARSGAANLSEAIYEYYSEVPGRVSKVPAAGFPQGSWTYLDVAVAADIWLKKYTFLETEAGDAKHWPVMVPVESEGNDGLDDVRPLAVARAFIASFLRKLGGEAWDAPAWDVADDEAVLGGPRLPQVWRHHAIAMDGAAPSPMYYDQYGDLAPPWQPWVREMNSAWQLRPASSAVMRSSSGASQ